MLLNLIFLNHGARELVQGHPVYQIPVYKRRKERRKGGTKEGRKERKKKEEKCTVLVRQEAKSQLFRLVT